MTTLKAFTRAIGAIGAYSTLSAATGEIYRNGSVLAPCNSTLFCYGEILHEIQIARPFSDSKTFVDMLVFQKQNYSLPPLKGHVADITVY